MKPPPSESELRVYLDRRIRSCACSRVISALAALLVDLLVLLVTFWVVYGALFVALDAWVPVSHVMRLWLSAGYLVLIFLGYARTDSEYLSQLRVETVDGRPAYTIYLRGGWRVRNVNWLNPTNVVRLPK